MTDKSLGKRLATILKTLVPAGVTRSFGVTWDGSRIWVVDGAQGRLVSLDPETGQVRDEFPTMHADAGLAHDGEQLFLLAGDEILRVQPKDGRILGRIPTPEGLNCSGLAHAAGALWVGDMRGRRIAKLDPETGELLKMLSSERLVTGVTFSGAELWHAAPESDDEDVLRYELRRLDPETGEVLEVHALPEGVPCSGLAADEAGRFYCGDSFTGEVRLVERG